MSIAMKMVGVYDMSLRAWKGRTERARQMKEWQ